MTGGKTLYDPNYNIGSPFMLELLAEIHQNDHGIGFHPSYNAFNDTAAWGEEYKRLTRVSPQNISAGRGHYLRFELPATWQINEDYGMEWDGTLGYADHEGFRCGTCYDYNVFNFLTRRKLKLKEVPLIFMEVTMACYRKLPPDEMWSRIKDLIDQVKLYQGNFVFLWHNSNFNTPFWEPYKTVYTNILRYYADIKTYHGDIEC